MRLGALRAVVISVMSVAALVTGFGQATLGTERGRDVVVSAALAAANRSLHGTVTARSTGGSLLRGLVAEGVTVTGHDGRPLAAIGRLVVRYRLPDFLSGRVVLGEIELDSVRVDLEQRPGERFNYEQVLRLGEDKGEGGGGRPPLIAFRNARVRNLYVLIRTPDPADSTAFVERDLRVAQAVLPYARISSPLPMERGIHLEFAALDAVLSAPRLSVTAANGTLEILGDTIAVDFRTVRMPGSHSSMRGRFVSLRRDLKVDLAFRARAFASDDLRALFDWMPAGVSGSGAVEVRSDPGDVLVVRAHNLDLTFADGGTARGTYGMDIGPARPGRRARWTWRPATSCSPTSKACSTRCRSRAGSPGGRGQTGRTTTCACSSTGCSTTGARIRPPPCCGARAGWRSVCRATSCSASCASTPRGWRSRPCTPSRRA